MHAYADDPQTPEDEGAEEGDASTFRVNGCPASYEAQATWVSRARSSVTLQARCNPI